MRGEIFIRAVQLGSSKAPMTWDVFTAIDGAEISRKNFRSRDEAHRYASELYRILSSTEWHAAETE